MHALKTLLVVLKLPSVPGTRGEYRMAQSWIVIFVYCVLLFGCLPSFLFPHLFFSTLILANVIAKKQLLQL